jgi:hypothetical protein
MSLCAVLPLLAVDFVRPLEKIGERPRKMAREGAR